MQLQICLHTKWRHWKWMFKPFTFQGCYSLVALALWTKPHHTTHTYNICVMKKSGRHSNPWSKPKQSEQIPEMELQSWIYRAPDRSWKCWIMSFHYDSHPTDEDTTLVGTIGLDVIFQHVHIPWAMDRSATCKVQWWIVTSSQETEWNLKGRNENKKWGDNQVTPLCKKNNAGCPINPSIE